MWEMQVVRGDRVFQSIEEVNEFVSALSGPALAAAMAGIELTPAQQAQAYAYDAMTADSWDEAERLVRRALAVDPSNVDAQVMLAEMEAETASALAARLAVVVEGAEGTLGAEFIEEHTGRFWGVLDTRPYMRALHSYASALLNSDQYSQAAAIYRRMLTLNSGDNQGIREVLIGLAIALGDIATAESLLQQYPDAGPVFTIADSLLHVMAGDNLQAEALLLKAMKENDYLIPMLLGIIEYEDYADAHNYSLNSPEHAALILTLLGPAFMKQPQLYAWVMDTIADIVEGIAETAEEQERLRGGR